MKRQPSLHRSNLSLRKQYTLNDYMKAIWNNTILAESDQTIVVEGNHYFPPEAINTSLFQSSNYQTTCPWKGKASYYSLLVNEEENTDAAWYYPEPSDAAAQIKGYVAFWKGVEISE